MELHIRQISDVTRLNMSTSARISQALRVNDIGTAQKLAASVAVTSAQLRPSTPVVPSGSQTKQTSEHQVDVWA
jgi:hypothetical protein